MKLPRTLLIAGLLPGLTSLTSAKNILLVSDLANGDLETFLTGEGHVVSRESRADGPNDDDNPLDAFGDANDFDLVIIDRNTNSVNYQSADGTKQAAWNSVSTPTILLSSFLFRNNRLGYVASTTTGSDATTESDSFDAPYPDPSHPFLASLSDPAEQVYTAPKLLRYLPNGVLLDSGVTTVATAEAGAGAAIFTIETGTVLADTLGTQAGGLRIGWIMHDGGEWALFNSNGQQIMRNMIDFATIPPGDADGDGMGDVYEDLNGLDKNDDGTMFPDLGPNGDKDMDGLTNIQEHDGLDSSNVSHGFGQTRADMDDTDGDLVLDNDEITGANNAFQTNVAGDAPTFAPGLETDPNNPDTDGDGVDDGGEIFGTANTAHSNEPTNPNSNDTDGDLMLDDYEITNNLLGGLDPNTDDAAGNLDGDAGPDGGVPLTNLDEFNGTSLGVQTRADKADTDDDGYDDVAENGTNTWVGLTATGTNPVNSDTDGDGLFDGEENPDLAPYPGPGAIPTNSDPNILDGDGDGLNDGYEVFDYQTNPALVDSDGDGASDPGEIFIFLTDPLEMSDAPTAAQLAELRVNFIPTGGPTAPDFQHYEADHEILASFDDTVFSGFGGIDNITVGLSWDGGANVAPTAPQMFNRGNLLDDPNTVEIEGVEWAPFHRSWAGTDERTTPSAPMTVTVSGLPAGNYLWTSHHGDQGDRQESFIASVTSASGTSDSIQINPVSGMNGANEFLEIATYQQTFSSNGVDPITVEFDSNGAFFFMNGFLITNSETPPEPSDLKITGVAIESATGDLLIDFTPAGSDRILTSSDDLSAAFVEETEAALENGDSRFRVPAENLNPGSDFFRVEDAP